jgi:hypothetical protein
MHHGVSAQQVQSIIAETGIDFGGFKDGKVKGGSDQLGINYSEFIAPLIKSVQELTQKNKELVERLEKVELKER